MMDWKGILEGVLLDGQFQYNWIMYSLPKDNLAQAGLVTTQQSLSRSFFPLSRLLSRFRSLFLLLIQTQITHTQPRQAPASLASLDIEPMSAWVETN